MHILLHMLLKSKHQYKCFDVFLLLVKYCSTESIGIDMKNVKSLFLKEVLFVHLCFQLSLLPPRIILIDTINICHIDHCRHPYRYFRHKEPSDRLPDNKHYHFHKCLFKPSAYPIGIAAIRELRVRIPFRLYPTVSSAGTSCICKIVVFKVPTLCRILLVKGSIPYKPYA